MKRTTAYLLLICLVSAMGGLLFGYDWVVIGGAKIFYEPFSGLEGSAALRGVGDGSALIGCLAGALLSGEWVIKYGRKDVDYRFFPFCTVCPTERGRSTVLTGLSFIV